MRLDHYASVLAVTAALSTLAACAIGSRAKDDRKSGPAADDGIASATGKTSSESRPPSDGTGSQQIEGRPPPGKELPEPESRPPAEPIPDSGTTTDPAPPLPPGFFDAGSGEPVGKATVREGGA